MSDAAVPYSLLRTLRACLDGTADQPAWDRAKDELDDLLLAEPDCDSCNATGPLTYSPDHDARFCGPCMEREAIRSPVVSAACSLASMVGQWDEPLRRLAKTQREYLAVRPGPEGDGDPC